MVRSQIIRKVAGNSFDRFAKFREPFPDCFPFPAMVPVRALGGCIRLYRGKSGNKLENLLLVRRRKTTNFVNDALGNVHEDHAFLTRSYHSCPLDGKKLTTESQRNWFSDLAFFSLCFL